MGEAATGIRRDQLVTLGDLEVFKQSLLAEIKLMVEPNAQQQNRIWLRSAEVRRMLGVSPGTLQNFRVNGSLPFTKIGGIIFYRYDDIMTVLHSNLSEPKTR